MNDTRQPQRERGEAFELAIHIVLLLLVLGQVVFLASRLRWRCDLTSDASYSLTESTRKILSGLEQRLLIECYFSEKEKLPTDARDGRIVLDNFLDELVQVGKGRVVVQRFNPNEDKAIADKCTRIGVKPIDLRSNTSSSLAVNRAWQGLRLLYGGDKQRVLEQVGGNSQMLEAIITPAIKEVITKEKKKLGFMEWPEEPAGGQANQALGWSYLRGIEGISKRYEFVNVKDAEGTLIPADYDTLFLFRPKDLSDRQKYVIDQFLMRGGNVVVFADVVDYQIGQYRSFNRAPAFNLDAKDSQVHWVDQLAHYGIELRQKLIGDAQTNAVQTSTPGELMTVIRPGLGGMQAVHIDYPYFFHPVAYEWKQVADILATDTKTKTKDAEKADYYRRHLEPGMPSDEFLFAPFKKLGRGPAFYWPCSVDLVRKAGDPQLPAGVTGSVLLWSSPYTIVEDPPPNLNPAVGRDAKDQLESLNKFFADLKNKLEISNHQQVPLMVDLKGKFPSFFEGRERPKRESEIKEEAAKKQAEEQAKGQDPLKEPVKESPEAPKKDDAKKEPPKKGGPRLDPQEPQPAQNPPAPQGTEGSHPAGQASPRTETPAPTKQEPVKPEAQSVPTKQEPAKQEPAKVEPAKQEAGNPATPGQAQQKPAVQLPQKQGPIGPPAPKPQEQAPPAPEAPPVYQATAAGRIVVVGDSDFLRDDFVRGDNDQRGGPHSLYGAPFFANMLDWLSQDRDLVALQSRVPKDRSIKLVEQKPEETQLDFEKRVEKKQRLLLVANVVLPALLLGLIGVFVWTARRAQKQSFLTSVGN